MSFLSRKVLIVGLLVALAMVAGCGRRGQEQRTPTANWTPSAMTGSLQLATPGAAIRPTDAPGAAAVAQATAAPVGKPIATRAAPVVQATATRDPNIVIVTEQDVLTAVTSGATAQEGADFQGVAVDFQDERMRLTAERASYRFVTVNNLEIVGRLVARDGKLQMDTESVSPRGVVTALIPTIANQALANYTSRWYVEDVKTFDDRLELRIRP